MEELDELKIALLRAKAVREAMVELLSEHREELQRRARAKLVAMGLKHEQIDGVSDEQP